MTEPFTNNDLDLLMSLDPLSLTKDDLDAIVRYHRNLRAEREAGKGKAARRTAAGNGPKLDISKLMSSIVTAQPSGNVIKRRV
jgi:hypothetical protein